MSRAKRNAARARVRPAHCDWCSSEVAPSLATWRFPCQMFVAQSAMPEHALQYRGDWGACDECRPLVEAQDWDRLIDRCVDRAPGLYIRAMNASIEALRRLGALPAVQVREGRELAAAREWQAIFWAGAWEGFAQHRRGPAEPIRGGEIFPDPLVLRKVPR
ncbi:MAG: hypothetical protein ACR2I5_05800 [Candidatus Limnocylindria bacterium]